MKEEIVKKVILSEDKTFLTQVAAFISSTQQKHSDAASDATNPTASVDVHAFWKQLTEEYGEVLQQLAQ